MNREQLADWLDSFIEATQDDIAWRDGIVLEAIATELRGGTGTRMPGRIQLHVTPEKNRA